MQEIPLLPRTEEVLAFYAPSLRREATLWIIIPLLIIFDAGPARSTAVRVDSRLTSLSGGLCR